MALGNFIEFKRTKALINKEDQSQCVCSGIRYTHTHTHTHTTYIVVVQLLSYVWLFVILWTAAHQASPSQCLLKLTSIELVMPSNPLILCCPLLFLPSILPSIRIFFHWVGSSHQVAKVLELQQQSFQWIFRVDLF